MSTLVKYVQLEANDWHREQFVDNEAILPHSHRIPSGSGKIGAVGKVETIQALHQKDATGRNNIIQVLRTEDPYTHAHVLEAAPRFLEPESVMYCTI